ncbi:chemotaxis-specific protein-glutamate methyltransferase CheB [Thiorhodococcus mannitoliphagus]|uniref:Protein-glutamate methylesterase/protein-glutamine glutaminase n=1 Tax=Thiorhodococcus mannitoliphagus TaxID=329406 RepID=A0A6P1DN09_9GAMM|nr:chemotaxis-specific protein-glutamate methyltransferase CheB [Thiorhodococcus mannitoliphagus]NEX19637.1 chemotaxis-specific protein-glutamate methyltransferase CheB [Thiorhodococcus mannitoliphagus]
MIKLLIVDDSALMRRQLANVFQAEADFEIRQARNGREAVEENRAFEPDVVTLDINMPEMDGITALSLLMAERPVPVVMVSSLTEKGALATFEALNLGAVDYLAKPGGTISLSIEEISAELVAKVRAAAGARLKRNGTRGLTRRLREERVRPAPRPLAVRRGVASDGLVVIGVSTGGPRTLEDILPLWPADFPWPVLVSQHMPASFTRPFAERMNALCALEVVEVARPMPVEPGTVYIGKGGADMVVGQRGGRLTVLSKPESQEFLWHPSVELLGRSVLEHCDPARVIAIMLTGMGYDGADAFAEIKQRGGRTIAESEQSAVVFGMPAELIARQGASLVLPAEKIAAQVNTWTGR